MFHDNLYLNSCSNVIHMRNSFLFLRNSCVFIHFSNFCFFFIWIFVSFKFLFHLHSFFSQFVFLHVNSCFECLKNFRINLRNKHSNILVLKCSYNFNVFLDIIPQENFSTKCFYFILILIIKFLMKDLIECW